MPSGQAATMRTHEEALLIRRRKMRLGVGFDAHGTLLHLAPKS